MKISLSVVMKRVRAVRMFESSGFLAVGIAAIGAAAGSAWGAAPTYQRHVARIPPKTCQDCHRRGQVAPFSLLTYEQARKRADDIAGVTEAKTMPPWPASTEEGGPFRDARLLDPAEIATLQAWVEAGCPEGNPEDAPP